MHYHTTFLCTKFQGNRVTRFHFIVTLTPLRKEEKKQSGYYTDNFFVFELEWHFTPLSNTLVV